MFLLLHRQVVKHLAAARIAGNLGGARVELEPAPLGGDGDAQRVAGKDEVRVPGIGRRRRAACSAGLTRAVDLTTLWDGVNARAPDTSSISASMSELRNSNERWQFLQIR
jgi:hypothetical protein